MSRVGIRAAVFWTLKTTIVTGTFSKNCHAHCWCVTGTERHPSPPKKFKKNTTKVQKQVKIALQKKLARQKKTKRAWKKALIFFNGRSRKKGNAQGLALNKLIEYEVVYVEPEILQPMFSILLFCLLGCFHLNSVDWIWCWASKYSWSKFKEALPGRNTILLQDQMSVSVAQSLEGRVITGPRMEKKKVFTRASSCTIKRKKETIITWDKGS